MLYLVKDIQQQCNQFLRWSSVNGTDVFPLYRQSMVVLQKKTNIFSTYYLLVVFSINYDRSDKNIQKQINS